MSQSGKYILNVNMSLQKSTKTLQYCIHSQGLCKTYLGTTFANVIFWLFFENCRMHYTRTRCTLHCLCMTDACEYERQWEKYVELSHNSSYESSDSVSRSITHF